MRAENNFAPKRLHHHYNNKYAHKEIHNIAHYTQTRAHTSHLKIYFPLRNILFCVCILYDSLMQENVDSRYHLPLFNQVFFALRQKCNAKILALSGKKI